MSMLKFQKLKLIDLIRFNLDYFHGYEKGSIYEQSMNNIKNILKDIEDNTYNNHYIINN